MADFVKVARLSDLASGTSKTVQVSGKTVALFNVDGKVYAIDNSCLHRGGPLGEGTLKGEIVTCPWHMWDYNVRTGEYIGDPAVKVATYAVRVEGNDIKIAI